MSDDLKMPSPDVLVDSVVSGGTGEGWPRQRPTIPGFWTILHITFQCTHCHHVIECKLGEDRPHECPECHGYLSNWEGRAVK